MTPEAIAKWEHELVDRTECFEEEGVADLSHMSPPEYWMYRYGCCVRAALRVCSEMESLSILSARDSGRRDVALLVRNAIYREMERTDEDRGAGASTDGKVIAFRVADPLRGTSSDPILRGPADDGGCRTGSTTRDQGGDGTP